MKIDYTTITPKEAVALQRRMQEKVKLTPLKKKIKAIAGADISFNRFSPTVYAGIVILSYPDMEVIETAHTVMNIKFPYVPGLLAFREVPALLEIWNSLKKKPDLVVLDGHGIAHPRRLGVATHFSMAIGKPTIGCAKSLLGGEYKMPPNRQFAATELSHKGELIGKALRTKVNCKPVFVSPGHLITLDESLEVIKNCTGKYRLPEPTRQAHVLVNKVRKEHN